MVRIQKFFKENSDFSFDFEHISGKHMLVSDFLSRFSSDNQDEQPFPYLMDTSCLDNVSYMFYLDNMCNFNYNTQQGNSELRTQEIIYLIQLLFKRLYIYIFKCRYFDGLGRHLLRQNFVTGTDATP